MMKEAILRIIEDVDQQYLSIYSRAASEALSQVTRRIHALFDKELDGRVPAANFVATLAANVENSVMDDKTFREFVRRTLPIVEGAPPSEEPTPAQVVERHLDAEIQNAHDIERTNRSALADVPCTLRAVKARLLTRLLL